MQYNEKKFRLLQEESRSLNAALQEISDRRRAAKPRFDQLQVEISNAGRKPPRELEINLRHARADFEQLVELEEKAAQAWQEVGALVRSCTEFLAEKGIRIDNTSHRTVNPHD